MMKVRKIHFINDKSIGITGFVKAVNIICIKYLGMKKEKFFL